MEKEANNMSISLSPKQIEIVSKPFKHTLEVNEGTPRSGKTTAGHFRFARYLIETEDENHLIAAYNQEQAHRLFVDGDGTGLQHIFGDLAVMKHNDLGDYLEVTTPKGIRKVYLKGGGKADSVKAITGMSLGSVVFCEINLLHMDFIQECFRRTFAAKSRFHLADLNPPAPSHPVIKDVFEVQDTDWKHWTIHDNPILTNERKEEIKKVLEKNPYLYARDWDGRRVMPQGVIYSMYDRKTHLKPALKGEIVEMFFAADGGQSDATSCSCNIITRHEGKFILNRVAHYYHSGSETGQVKAMSIYAREIKVFIQWCRSKFDRPYQYVFVDPACKSLREELHLLNIDTTAADNNKKEAKGGSGSGIEIGIERCQSALTEGFFYLVECEKFDHYNFEKEIGMYVRDKNSKPIDDFNHSLDEFRYSMNYFYKNYIL